MVIFEEKQELLHKLVQGRVFAVVGSHLYVVVAEVVKIIEDHDIETCIVEITAGIVPSETK